jgi:hypothetical protein
LLGLDEGPPRRALLNEQQEFFGKKSDQALLAVMRANPDATLADLIRLGRRPRTSTVASLKRLEDAGLVEHPSKGQYRVVDQVTTPKPAWIQPVSGRRVARHAADGRVRDELTMT